MKARLLVRLLVVGTFLSYALIARCWTINATGGSFPNKFYADTTFVYQFQPSGDFVTYFGAGSTTGKCNIMGYWHTGDTLASQSSIPATTKARDALICTDACTVATCGISSVTSPRFDRNSRRPLVDFAGSDSVLKAADYEAFPDLLMFPALAGAVVPLYNIPELRAVSNISLVLSRQNIADIFKGEVLFWNDSRILASNPVLRSTLIKISHRIRVLVRTDSSGTSEIFSTALARFDPMGIRSPDYSFAATVGAGSNPSWCGLLTDEIQILTIMGCNPALSNIQNLIYMKVVSAERSMRDLTFACDASAENITAEFARTYPGANLTVVVNKKVTSTGIVKLQIGYGDPLIAGQKWYKPAIVSLPVGVTVSISTLQEGGYFNSHYNSTYVITTQIQSIWIASSTSSFRFVVSLRNIMGTEYNITLTAPTSENEILASFNSVIANSVEKVRLLNSTSSPWTEFRVTFTGIASSQLSAFTVHSELQRNSDAVYITTYLDFNNYPLFYDYKHPTGFGGSGRYTCYLKQYGYKPWSYYTGDTNSGIVAEVYTTPYTIGYSVLTDAMKSSLPIASMINKAQSRVVASATSVAYAVMGEGGNLDANSNALLVDSSSTNAWPIAGFSYYIIRSNTHIGSCSRRTAAMKYLINYYYDDGVKEMAADLGFATIPDFIRDTITLKIVKSAKCNNGQYALSQLSITPTDIIVTDVLEPLIRRYLSIYNSVDTSTKWNLISHKYSSQVWTDFIRAPYAVSGVFTMFSGREDKIFHLHNNSSDISTFAFGHVAVVFIYHLDYFSACTDKPLRVTNEILQGIFLGTISSWKDSKIQDANKENKACLPDQEITVIIQSDSSEAASILLRFFSLTSSTFKQSIDGADDQVHHFNFSTVIPSNRLKFVPDNKFSDSAIISKDSTFGFYLQVSSPVSPIASYCSDRYCDGHIVVPNNFGKSIGICHQDVSTIVNPSRNFYTYDLMTSKAPGCYPIVGTLDYSFYATDNVTACLDTGSPAHNLIHDRVKFSTFLFNGTAIVKPLNVFSAAPSAIEQRAYAIKSICDQTCDGTAMGYEHCNYRDCSWAGGDYIQSVSSCSPATQRRTVTYTRDNTTCYNNQDTALRSEVLIECSYVLGESGVAVGAILVCIIGVTACGIILFLSFKFSREKVLRRSQLIFIYIFLWGAILMNLTVLSMYGPNSASNCMLRVWAVNITSTLMFAPLIMKLHRVDVLYHTLQRGGRRRTISDFTVGLQVLGLLSVDIAILLAWTFVDQPRPIAVTRSFPGVYDKITDITCNTSIEQPFERAMVTWKALLLLFGVIKSIRTWSVPKEISEAKHFALAIYNIAVVGSMSYFLSIFGIFGADATVALKCAGIFTSATVSAAIIMIPKLLSIQLSWSEVFAASSSSSRDYSGSSTRSRPGMPTNVPVPMSNKTGIPLNLESIINAKALIPTYPLDDIADRNHDEIQL